MSRVPFVSVVLIAVALSTPSAQSETVTPIMREKLTNAQHLLEGVVTGDYALMSQYGARLGRISLKEIGAWQTRAEPEYLRHGRSFLQAVTEFRSAVWAKKTEETAVAYQRILASCTGCHRYIGLTRPASVPQ